MSTGRDIVTASLKKIGAIAPGDSISASEADDGIAELNRMLSSWSTEELMNLEAFIETLALDTEIVMPAGYEDAMVYNLAVRLAPDYGKQVSADIAAMAMETKGNVKRSNHRSSYLEVDAALLPRTRYNILTGEFE